MEPELTARIAALEGKVDAMYASVEKIRKYFLWTGIVSIALFVLPLIGLILVIPSFINSYAQLGTLDQGGSQSTSQLDTLNSLLQ